MDHREQHPTLLKKANRGKFYDITSVPSKYGEVVARSGVAGIELLDAYEKGELELDENGKFSSYLHNLLFSISCFCFGE